MAEFNGICLDLPNSGVRFHHSAIVLYAPKKMVHGESVS